MTKFVIAIYNDIEVKDKYPVGIFASIYDAEVAIYEKFEHDPDKRARFEFTTLPFDAIDYID